LPSRGHGRRAALLDVTETRVRPANDVTADTVKRARAYWSRQLASPLPGRSVLPDGDGAAVRVEATFEVAWSPALSAALLRLACEDDSSLYVLLLAVYHVFLDRLAVEEGEPAILCPTGESAGEVPIVVAIRARPRPTQRFSDLVFELREAVLEAHAHACFGQRELAGLTAEADPAALCRYVLLSRNLHGAPLVDGADLTFKIDHFEDRLILALRYDASQWEEQTAHRFLDVFTSLAERAAADPRRTVAEIGRLPIGMDERGRETSRTAATFVEMFEAAALAHPQHPALVSAVEMPNIYNPSMPKWFPVSLTYAALNGRANLLARALVGRGVRSGCVVGILVEDPFNQVGALIGVGKAGAAYLMLDERQPVDLQAHVLAMAGVEVLIAERHLVVRLPAAARPETVLYPDDAAAEVQDPRNLDARPDPTSPSYVCFTSGTTSRMKGVVVEHAAVANYTAWRMRELASSSSDVTLQLVPWSADGSGANLFPTLCAGGTLVVASRVVRTDPARVAALMAHFGVTQMSLVPSVFREILGSLSADAVRQLRTLVLAGEPASAELVQRTLALAPNLTIYNEYGPTEATIASAAHRGMRPESLRVVGRPVDNVRLRVANHRGEPMPVGIPGEIWISGMGLARGYINDPALTRERFVEEAEGRRWYRSRDAGLWDADETLHYIGRLDRQRKHRGQRVDLAFLNGELRRIAGLQEVHVELGSDGSGLRAWVASAPDLDAGAIKASLARELPDYMIPETVRVVPWLPRLASGRVDVAALAREAECGAEREMSELEARIAEVFREVLGLHPGAVGPTSNFFELGGHSLKVTQLAGRLLAGVRVNLRISEIYDAPTVEALAKRVGERQGPAGKVIARAPERETHPASLGQERIYLRGEGAATNCTVVVDLKENIDPARLERTLMALVERHEALRTSFTFVGGELRQRIHLAVNRIDGAAELGRPFALDVAPLLRASFASDRVVLETHALAADAESLAIIHSDLRALYDGATLPPLSLRHRDWTEWVAARMRTAAFQASARFWRDRLAGGAPRLTIATPPAATAKKKTKTKTKTFLSAKLAPALADRTFLFATCAFTLAALARQTRFIVGLCTSGRFADGFQGVVGNFASMTPVICALERDARFSDLLLQSKYDLLDADEHQFYPFEQLAEAQVLPRDASGQPVFDVAIQHQGGPAWDDPSCALIVATSQDTVTVGYNPAAVATATAERFLAGFLQSSAVFAASPDVSLGDVIASMEV
jgi:amino acid adenylation domain-containing protein